MSAVSPHLFTAPVHTIFTPPDSSLEPKLETLESFSLISFILSKFLLSCTVSGTQPTSAPRRRPRAASAPCAAPHSACAASRTVRSYHGYPSRSLTLSIKLGKSA